MLLPQALCTIAAVGALFATVRRVAGDAPALIAALAFALSPIAIAVARVNNPDALLVLLLVLSAYFTVRALESGRTKHLAIAGALVGLAFMTKMLQGWMIVPALAAAYVVFAPVGAWTRVRQLLIAGAVMVLVSVAWPVAVSLWPGAKPYIGGSTDGSVWDLILGYNGFGRIFGEGGGMGGGGGGRRSAAPPAGCGCSTRRSAGRSPGCCRSRASRSPMASGRRAGSRAPVSRCSASGRSCTSPSSRPSRASSIRTTSARSRRPSPRWSGWA